MSKSTTAARVEPSVDSMKWAWSGDEQRIFPKGEWKTSGSVLAFMYGAYESVEHPFLQKLIDIGAHVTRFQGEIVVFAYESMMMLHVYKDFINLECITTPADLRMQGSGTKTMKALVHVSKETGIPIRLRAGLVSGPGPAWMIPAHIVVVHGAKKKNKIPISKLKAWYQSFGFTPVGLVKVKGVNNGWNMEYKPKPIK